jgi:hypothetical protein
MPQYQNLQAQQRQEQLNQVFNNTYNYNFVRERSEAENWPIAPGNHLVFEDQNGVYFYTKSLGFAPNDRPVFSVFRREDFVEKEQPKEETKDKFQESITLEMSSVKNDISELKELVKELSTKPKYDNYKKGGGK